MMFPLEGVALLINGMQSTQESRTAKKRLCVDYMQSMSGHLLDASLMH